MFSNNILILPLFNDEKEVMKMKIQYKNILSTLLLSCSAVFAAHNDCPSVVNVMSDPCDNITGTWKGFWDAPYARSLCSMTANITKDNDSITVHAEISPRSFLTNCHNAHLTIDGSCKNGKVIFQQNYLPLTGYIKGNEIKLDNVDEGIRLEKVS